MMINLLTKYLLQYRTVTIPQVGTIQLIQQPARLDVAAKMIQPPCFSAELQKADTVSSHQLHFLSEQCKKSTDIILDDLKNFGNQVSDQIKRSGYDWIGIGRFDQYTNTLSVPMEGLEPVTAERVMRENRDHHVLVGDREMTSHQIADEKAVGGTVVSKHSVLVIAGWIILAISILFLAFMLYRGKFKVNATGSKQSPTSQLNLENRQYLSNQDLHS